MQPWFQPMHNPLHIWPIAIRGLHTHVDQHFVRTTRHETSKIVDAKCVQVVGSPEPELATQLPCEQPQLYFWPRKHTTGKTVWCTRSVAIWSQAGGARKQDVTRAQRWNVPRITALYAMQPWFQTMHNPLHIWPIAIRGLHFYFEALRTQTSKIRNRSIHRNTSNRRTEHHQSHIRDVVEDPN